MRLFLFPKKVGKQQWFESFSFFFNYIEETKYAWLCFNMSRITHAHTPRQDDDTTSVPDYYRVYLHLFYPCWLQIEVKKSWEENSPEIYLTCILISSRKLKHRRSCLTLLQKAVTTNVTVFQHYHKPHTYYLPQLCILCYEFTG